jgi:hypothetical protein
LKAWQVHLKEIKAITQRICVCVSNKQSSFILVAKAGMPVPTKAQLIHERLKFHKCFHKLGCTLEMFDQEDSTSQNPNQKIDEANDILGQWNFSGSASSCKGCIILISTTRLIVTFALAQTTGLTSKATFTSISLVITQDKGTKTDP